jgi:hypothetical protein
MAQSKLEQRKQWILTHKAEIESARTPVEKNSKNAARIKGMSAGGYGFWAQAFDAAGVDDNSMPYWSGSAPTPSTAINLGIAKYIQAHAPNSIK